MTGHRTQEKQCSKCGQLKPVDRFSLKNGSPDGRKSQCKQCSCELEKIRRLTNPVEYSKRRKVSYAKRRRAIIDKAINWSKQNVQRRRDIALRYALKNIQKIRQYQRDNLSKFRQGRRRRQALRKAAQLKSGGFISKSDWNKICESTGGVCSYCGVAAKLSIDHFVPISKGGKTEVGNLIPACVTCNSRKSNRAPNEWVIANFGASKLREIYAKFIK